jgi:hypothetical protein
MKSFITESPNVPFYFLLAGAVHGLLGVVKSNPRILGMPLSIERRAEVKRIRSKVQAALSPCRLLSPIQTAMRAEDSEQAEMRASHRKVRDWIGKTKGGDSRPQSAPGYSLLPVPQVR